MGGLSRTTVDRLDRPSAYYAGKVIIQRACCKPAMLILSQNKKRKYSYDDSDRPYDALDSLANATTLYVGNLYVG